MANLKLDLVNKLNDKKFHAELEFIRLAQEPSMNYKKKINNIQKQLKKLVFINAELGLVDQYFQEPEPAQAQANAPVSPPPPAPAPAQVNAHPGQSHVE